MATIKAYIRSPKQEASVYFRLSDGRDILIYHKSDIMVNPYNWNSTDQCIKANIWKDRNDDKRKFNKSITDRKEIIQTAYNNIGTKEGVTSQILEVEIDKLLHPGNYNAFDVIEEKPVTFFTVFDDYLKDRKLSTDNKLSVGRMNHFKVVKRILERYQLYTIKETNKPFSLDLNTITGDTLRSIDNFLRIEYTLLKTMPELYLKVPETREPKERGQNTINGIMTKIRTFILSSIDGGLTINNPFKNIAIEKTVKGKTSKVIIKGFKIGVCKYGSPFYLSIEERNKLYHTDFSNKPQLEIQKDIFVFQSLIGCRVGDLYKMTKSNIIDGVIQYIPGKTKDENSNTVKVPLNATAKEILNKYQNADDVRLFKFISEQKYNVAIKEAFKVAGLTRMVTVINPTTGETEQQPLNKIASSHLARRSFIGGLYKQVSDPNLIGSMTGHVEGSKSFARYREIDNEMKKDLVKLLD